MNRQPSASEAKSPLLTSIMDFTRNIRRKKEQELEALRVVRWRNLRPNQ